MSGQQQLPPGWIAQWDQNHGRYLFIDTATNHSQWEPPVHGAPMNPDSRPQTVSPGPGHGPAPTQSKRRQYAADQTQAYYGGADMAPVGPPSYMDQPIHGGGGAGSGGLFTPGLTAEAGGQPPYYAPDTPSWQNGGQSPGPAYAQPPYVGGGGPHGQPQMGALADQFSQMGMSQHGAMGQKPFGLHTTNLIGVPIDPRELLRPPPEIRLPPGACLSQNPLANADPSYMRSTINAVPTTSSLLNKSKISFGLVLTPHRSIKDGDEPVPVVTDTVIARCRRCRAYINPYVQFIDGGNRWKCCLCSMSNEVPQLFDWDQQRNQPADRWSRLELNHSAVDFVAPTEYMVRPPQPPVYVFLLDISHAAVSSGMVATATRTILESLDRLPNADNRTKVAIIAFDVALHFFSIPPGGTEASMLVVSDLDDVFLPKPTDLLINLSETRAGLEALLTKMGDMFQESHTVGSAMGPALQAGFKLCASVGAKIIVLSASLPTLGAGALKNREDNKVLGTAKESALLQAASSFYKLSAIDCVRDHISVDMFLFSPSYTDVATLNHLPHYTAGGTYFYPAFNATRSEDAIKFAHEFGEVLASPIGLEAVIRVRPSRGMRMSQYHGNVFTRSTDLLALPAVPVDQSYAIEVQIEENLNTPFVVFQCALLHTTCDGERRIRVITLALPTTNNISELYSSVDQIALITLLANKAVERSMSHKMEDAREALTNKLTDILGTYKNTMTSAGSGASAALSICDNMKMFPLLCLGLLKHVGLRQSAQIPPDLRAYAQALLGTLPSQLLIPYIHPTFYSLHNMPPECGTIGEGGVILPPPQPLTSERLERHGLFLIEDGQTIFLWVGREAVPQLMVDVFDLPSYDQLRGGKMTLPILDNPFSERVNAIIAKVREMRRGPYRPCLYVVKEDGEPPLRLWALSSLIQDRADQLPSYTQYLTQLKDKVNGSSYS
ncbi:hypothetical protein BOTBODRAFT_179058 [Botryobasidium botryosum FD-172 SS1]|uniref:WW domain-containing protein n=1 Tax=Botryobasidium botryosum (strain FD-172 SS1) TaxID=930990 RepID=A0A067M0V4_BOTB1|nr:hypothetical protein BOTBODRAFT_179058 [Botryobasidium botryosum FD-172 SS1]